MPSPRFQTLIEMLEARARRQPERVALSFAGRAISFGRLWRSIGRFAALLLRRGLRSGDRVVLALANGEDFFIAFYGVQRAGGVAVPIFPGSGGERLLALAGVCGARAVVVAAAGPKRAEQARAARQRRLTVLEAAPKTSACGGAFWPSPTVPGASCEAQQAPGVYDPPEDGFPRISPGDLSYLQYTSGSTGNPKGVRITHAMALANVEQLIAGLGITEGEVFVSWLPVYHDMGLVLMTMVPFYLPAKLVLLPASLTHIQRWLEAIERHRGTFTAAPDFAYRLCLRRIPEARAFDLSSLRVALDAAEPVRRQTIAKLEAAFGWSGVVTPAYGLAEATVGVAAHGPGQPAKVDGRGFVSVGRPFPGIEIAIVRGGARAAAGAPGEIAIRGPANTPGYYRNPEAMANLFWRGDYLLTGDLGYLDADGDLFIVGRQKNIIIHAGRNVAPGEIEEIADRVAGVRCSAAVGVDRGRTEGEQVYVFAEVRFSPAAGAKQAIAVEIVRGLHSGLGFRPGRVYLVRPRAIPRTANGKIRHPALKERYLDGSLRREGWILFPDY